MPDEKGQSSSHDVPGEDDLTRISGIESKTAQRLNEAGIRTYAELTSRSPDEIARLLPDLPPARLADWREQAGKLATGTPPPTAAEPDLTPHDRHETEGAAPLGNQRYESFLVRVLLNDDVSTRSTTVRHIRTGVTHRWAGWPHDALSAFIANAVASSPAPTAPKSERPEASAPGEASLTPSSVSAPHNQESPPSMVPSRAAEPSGRVRTLVPAHLASSADLSVERTVLSAAEPFTITVTIDLAGTGVQTDQFAYSAVISAKLLPGGPRRTIARPEGVIAAASPFVRVEAPGLSPGTYRLDGAVTVREPGADTSPGRLAAVAEGVVIHVTA